MSRRSLACHLRAALGVVALAGALAAPAAKAGLLVGIDSPANRLTASKLYQVNQSTGAATAFVTLNGPAVNASFTDVAYLGGKYYASDVETGSFQFGLVSIDPTTGATTILSANQGNNFNWQGLTAASSANLLYAVGQDNRVLSTFNVNTNAITAVGDTGVAGIGDLAYDAAGDILYGITQSGILYSINMTTGAATRVSDTGLVGFLVGLAYDSSDQAFYASLASQKGQPTNVYRFTLASAGSPTLLGAAGIPGMDGLTIVPTTNQVPEPGSLPIVLIALAGVWLSRRFA